jgi:hypothetical protein
VDSTDFSPWGDDDVEQLLRLIESGSSLAELSLILGRSQPDVERQAHFLGVLVPEHGELAVSTRTVDSSAVSATIHYAPFAQFSRRTPV